MRGLFIGTCVPIALVLAVASVTAGCRERSRSEIAITARTNVLLLTLCTLRADRVGIYGYPGDTTPNLDALARSGVFFESVLTPAPWTRASMAAMVTGLYPRTLDIEEPLPRRNDRMLAPRFETLAEALSAAGYFTVGITANPNTNMRFNFHQGFDFYRDTGILWRDGYKENKVAAKELTETLMRALEENPQRPFFAHLVYVDVHLPFPEPADPAAGSEASRSGPAWHSERYDEQLRLLDAEIGRLLEALSERESRDLLVVVNSDHGEGFGEVKGTDRLHGGDLYDSTIWVPWVLAHPSLAAPTRPGGRAIPGLASGVDLVPTLLDLLGLPRDAGLEGISHAGRVRGLTEALPNPREYGFVETRFLYTNKSAIVTRSHKLIAEQPTGGDLSLELFDRGIGDRVEQSGKAPDLARRLHGRLTAWQRAHPARVRAPRASSAPDDGEAEALRALGYVE